MSESLTNINACMRHTQLHGFTRLETSLQMTRLQCIQVISMNVWDQWFYAQWKPHWGRCPVIDNRWTHKCARWSHKGPGFVYERRSSKSDCLFIQHKRVKQQRPELSPATAVHVVVVRRRRLTSLHCRTFWRQPICTIIWCRWALHVWPELCTHYTLITEYQDVNIISTKHYTDKQQTTMSHTSTMFICVCLCVSASVCLSAR